MLIVGCGNAFRGDDAAGLHAAHRLRLWAPPEVVVTEKSGDLAALLDAWPGYDRVILIDAMRSGAVPGTIRRFDVALEPLPAGFTRPSTHHFGDNEAVSLGRQLGLLPRSLVVYGIEGRDFTAGAGVSPEVERAVLEVVERVLAEVAQSVLVGHRGGA